MIPRHLQIALSFLLLGIIGMALYILHLKRAEEQTAYRAVGDPQPMRAPVVGAKQRAALYVAYDADAALRRENIELELPADRGGRARELLRALLAEYLQNDSPHPLGAGADIKAVYLVEPGYAVVDTNAAFADRHRSGISIEALTIASIVQTLGANLPEVRRVKILVEGQERETLAGHADLMSFYEVQTVSELVRQLGSTTAGY